MAVDSINGFFEGRAGVPSNFRMPEVPKEIQAARTAMAGRTDDKDWTGLSYMLANSASDVHEYLEGERDAARIMMSANAPMFLLRYAYGTGKGMEAWLQDKPKDGKLKLTVTTMPSWHAGSGGYTAKRELQKLFPADGSIPTLTADQVIAAFKKDSSLTALIEKELGPMEPEAARLARKFNHNTRFTSADAKEIKEYLDYLVEDKAHEAKGMQFARENVYVVEVRTPDGQRIRKRFDVNGTENPTRGRKDKPQTATNSPEIEIDISAFAGKDLVVTSWPEGSAGVGGYKEARQITLHL